MHKVVIITAWQSEESTNLPAVLATTSGLTTDKPDQVHQSEAIIASMFGVHDSPFL